MIAGAIVVDSFGKIAGRPITLQGDHVWAPRSLLLSLRTWAEVPGRVMTLSYRGESHSVLFDHERGAISAAPVIDYADPEADDSYTLTLRFLEV